jgi:hypothetical protein
LTSKSNEQPKPRWPAVRSAISGFDRAALLELIRDLYGLTESNQRFVDARLGLWRAPLAHYKEVVAECMYPDVFRKRPIQISKAKKAISEYRKAARNARGEIELMVHFVECGNSFTLEYGDIDEGFYAALVHMYAKAIKAIKDLPDPEQPAFRDRLWELAKSADGIGWGYYDGLCDAFFSAFPEVRG